jgi:hypothetical protein
LKLEYLTEINIDYPKDDLIRLYDFDQAEARKFKSEIEDLIMKNKKTIDLISLDYIHQVNCSLVLKIGAQDRGIQKKDEETFDCELTHSKFREMIDLIQPFTLKNTTGYQWLYDLDPTISKTEFLFSPKGNW